MQLVIIGVTVAIEQQIWFAPIYFNGWVFILQNSQPVSHSPNQFLSKGSKYTGFSSTSILKTLSITLSFLHFLYIKVTFGETLESDQHTCIHWKEGKLVGRVNSQSWLVHYSPPLTSPLSIHPGQSKPPGCHRLISSPFSLNHLILGIK